PIRSTAVFLPGSGAATKNPLSGVLSSGFSGSQNADLGSLGAFGALGGFKTHFLVLEQGFATFCLNFGKVSEQIFTAVVRNDEAVAFIVVEPFHDACGHSVFPS